MFTAPATPPTTKAYQPKLTFQTGDLVRPRTDRATLCEVLNAEAENRIQVRGLDWPPGYSAILPAEEIYLVLRVETEGWSTPGRDS
jgi:hypothetical protein